MLKATLSILWVHSPNGFHAAVSSNELNELLHPHIKLKGRVQFAQLALVVVAPGEALGGVMTGQGLLHLPRHKEYVQVG